jgi:hypothetical protein
MTSALGGGGWSAPRPCRFTPGKDPVPIVQEASWAPGSVWTCAKNFAPTGIRSLDRPARSQLLYRLNYPAHAPPETVTHFFRLTCHVFSTEHSLKQMPGPINTKAGVYPRRHKVRKHFVFSSVSWHITKCRCLLLLVSFNFSAVQGCSLVLVRGSISELIFMGRT